MINYSAWPQWSHAGPVSWIEAMRFNLIEGYIKTNIHHAVLIETERLQVHQSGQSSNLSVGSGKRYPQFHAEVTYCGWVRFAVLPKHPRSTSALETSFPKSNHLDDVGTKAIEFCLQSRLSKGKGSALPEVCLLFVKTHYFQDLGDSLFSPWIGNWKMALPPSHAKVEHESTFRGSVQVPRIRFFEIGGIRSASEREAWARPISSIIFLSNTWKTTDCMVSLKLYRVAALEGEVVALSDLDRPEQVFRESFLNQDPKNGSKEIDGIMVVWTSRIAIQ